VTSVNTAICGVGMDKGIKKGGAYCMNLSAAPEPQGNLRGRSNVFPKSTSSAEMGQRKRPVRRKAIG
jgi:hypothetical protein